MSSKLSRRDFLKYTGMGSAAAFAAAYGMPLGTALAQAPPGDTAGHLVIYNFGGAEQQQMFANAIGRFNERYPNVVVEDLYIPWPEGWGHYITNLKLRAASGLKTDIIAIAIEGTRGDHLLRTSSCQWMTPSPPTKNWQRSSMR